MVCLPLVVLFLASLGSGSINFNVSEFCGLLNQMAATPGYLPSSPGSVFDAYDMVMAALASIPTSLWGTWNISSVDLKFLWAELQLAIILCEKDANARGFDFHPFAPCLDGLVLAPESHTLAFANNITQVGAFFCSFGLVWFGFIGLVWVGFFFLPVFSFVGDPLALVCRLSGAVSHSCAGQFDV
jgi:hypothetical protein